VLEATSKQMDGIYTENLPSFDASGAAVGTVHLKGQTRWIRQ